ncbi:MAG: hypothetical protein R2838_19230 [Caldilineaceae bacterium]
MYYFENGGFPHYFIGSADWMRRNLSDRVEAVVPVEDPRLKEQLDVIINAELNDYRQAWEMLPDGRYRLRFPAPTPTTPPASAPETLMRYTRAFATGFEEVS